MSLVLFPLAFLVLCGVGMLHQILQPRKLALREVKGDAHGHSQEGVEAGCEGKLIFLHTCASSYLLGPWAGSQPRACSWKVGNYSLDLVLPWQ